MRLFCNHAGSVESLHRVIFCPSMTKYITFSFQADKAVAEKKLSAAKPALEEAEAALQVSLAVFPLFFHDYGARN